METLIITSDDWNEFSEINLWNIDHSKKRNYYQLFGDNKRLKYFMLHSGGMEYVYFFHIIDGLIVGQCTLHIHPKEIWLLSISVDPDFKNKGISKEILKEVLEYVKAEDKPLVSSYYEEEGDLYVKHNIRRMCKERKIIFKDKESILSPMITHYY